MPKFKWDPAAAGGTGRYRDARGRFVKASSVRLAFDDLLQNAESPTAVLNEGLRNKTLNVNDWEITMREQIKNVHLSAIATERGGWENMTFEDYGRAGNAIREQYGYLRNFAEEIATGKAPMDGRMDVRANLYIKAGRETFYKSKQNTAINAGLQYVKSIRFLGDSCEECIAFDGVWYLIGDPKYKLPGQRICNKNCRCDEAYGKDDGDGVTQVTGD